MKPKIIFTGGGTAGHVTPNLALIQQFKEEGWDIAYMGSNDGIEKTMISPLGIPFYGVSSGKLRRYFSFKNALEPFKIIWGVLQSIKLFFQLKPRVVFSKGGYVAFPVVVGAWVNRVPVVAHESDMSPGLANRLCFPFVNKICLNFDGAKKYFKHQDKIEVTGTPIRKQLFKGDALKGMQFCGFTSDKPCIMVIGGSLGAGSINRVIREALPELTQEFQVIHICGKGKVDSAYLNTKGYCQLEYVNEQLADLFAASTVIISRAGANSLCEILALGKAHILIPLSAKASRGDQIQNARYFANEGVSIVVQDDDLDKTQLLSALKELMSKKSDIEVKIKHLNIESAAARIVAIIKEQAHVQSPRTV